MNLYQVKWKMGKKLIFKSINCLWSSFAFADSDIISQARADTCRLRYNTTNVAKLYAIARHIEPPGAVLFSTGKLF